MAAARPLARRSCQTLGLEGVPSALTRTQDSATRRSCIDLCCHVGALNGNGGGPSAYDRPSSCSARDRFGRCHHRHGRCHSVSPREDHSQPDEAPDDILPGHWRHLQVYAKSDVLGPLVRRRRVGSIPVLAVVLVRCCRVRAVHRAVPDHSRGARAVWPVRRCIYCLSITSSSVALRPDHGVIEAADAGLRLRGFGRGGGPLTLYVIGPGSGARHLHSARRRSRAAFDGEGAAGIASLRRRRTGS